MISQTAEYALRAIVHLAGAPESARTAQQIAEVTQVPAGYLSKVMLGLTRTGIVRSQRGLNGGFSLIKPPACLTVLEVVQAVDPIQRIRECPLGLKEHAGALCPLHRRLDEAALLVEESFRQTTIADLLPHSLALAPAQQLDRP